MAGCLSLAAADRDYWLKSERNGTPFAWEHIGVTNLPDGNIRYDYSNEVRTAGMSVQEEKSSYLVDRQLRPISFTSCTKEGNTETCTRGERAGNIMTVTAPENDAPGRRRSFDIRGFYFSSVLEDLIVKNAGRRRFSLRLLDIEKLQAVPARIEIRRAAGDALEASVQAEWTALYRLGRDGQVQEIRIEEVGIRTYPASAGDARNITTPKDSLFPPVKSRNPFPNPYNVTSARVQVKWKQLPVSGLRLHDNRQTLVRTVQSGDGYEAVVDLGTQGQGAPAARTRRPAGVYLGEDDYVKPRDPGIRRQAAEIIGGTKDPAAMVRALLTWVNGHIRYQLRSEILTGPQVLAKRTGRCAEYAVLLASLARAAGIPTRIVIGVAYRDGIWGGHMWDEVWLGEWIAVDASLGGPVVAPIYLKLSDSATVDGAMLVPKRIFGSLQVEILDFHEAGVNPALQTGIRGATYVNANFHCRIAAPDLSWELKEQTDEDGGRVLSMRPKEGAAVFALKMAGVTWGASVQGALEMLLQTVAEDARHYELRQKGEIEVAQRKAPSGTVAKSDANGNAAFSQYVMLIEGNCAYLFIWTAPREEFDRSTEVLRKILDSFELIR